MEAEKVLALEVDLVRSSILQFLVSIYFIRRLKGGQGQGRLSAVESSQVLVVVFSLVCVGSP